MGEGQLSSEAEPSGGGEESALLGWAYDEASRCVKCGFCLQACPTYVHFGVETASPRGRLALVRAAAEGSLPLDDALAAPLDLCLGCRACEPACPSGLQYGRVLEAARATLDPVMAGKRTPVERFLRRLVFRDLLPHPRRLRLLARLLGVAQRSGFAHLARFLVPEHLAVLVAGTPPAPTTALRRIWRGLQRPLSNGAGWIIPARGERRVRVAFFPGCVMDALFLSVNIATVRVLTRPGYEVVIPGGWHCCGALHAHGGMAEQARNLARRNLAALPEAEAAAGPVRAVISNSGGCGSHLKEYGHLFPGEAAAQSFSERTRDLSEWLVADLKVSPGWVGNTALRPQRLRVTYQESCHLSNGQRVTSQPRELLRAIPGLELVEMSDSNRCCGSAGIYNVTHPEVADALLDAKLQRVRETRAAVVVSANPGCHLQLRCGIVKQGLSLQVEVAHIAELLAQSL